MTNSPIFLTEYVTERGVELSLEDAAALRASVPSMTVARSWEGNGTFDLTPSSDIGVVGLSDRTVVIQPKVAISRVLFLISYALDPVRWQDSEAEFDSAPNLLEGMAALYLRALRNALRRGLLQGYREHEDSLTTIRGRIRFDDQVRRRFGASVPAEVRFDEFTEDTDLNRLLFAAVARLGRLPIRSRSIREGLAAGASTFADSVALVDHDPGRLPNFRWTRLNRHYKPAADLARLIIASTSLELGADERRATGMTVDMNVVFEEFLRAALREALGLGSSEFPSGDDVRPLSLDVADRIRLRPDLSWWRGNQCLFVGDAKYKRTFASGVNHPDLYQLHAYIKALGLDSGLLIYAAGEASAVAHRLADGTKLRVESLKLETSPTEILAAVGAFAATILAVRRDAPTARS
jgi:5-methylcytosine-specific restriction enzyme subunit McrC